MSQNPIIPASHSLPNLVEEMRDGVKTLNRQGLAIYGELSAEVFDVDLTDSGTAMIEEQPKAASAATVVFSKYLEALDTQDCPRQILVHFLQEVEAVVEQEAFDDTNPLREYYDNASTLPADPVPDLPNIMVLRFEPGLKSLQETT